MVGIKYWHRQKNTRQHHIPTSVHTARQDSETAREDGACEATKAEKSRWKNHPDNHSGQDCSQWTEAVVDDSSLEGSRKRLKCFCTNANSLVQKMDDLRELIRLNDYDIISVTETWATA